MLQASGFPTQKSDPGFLFGLCLVMSKRATDDNFSLNDEQMINKVGVECQPVETAKTLKQFKILFQEFRFAVCSSSDECSFKQGGGFKQSTSKQL